MKIKSQHLLIALIGLVNAGMIEIGTVENSLAIEFGTKIYLFQNPKPNFNAFWQDQISGL